jgi:hypothetical protein
LERAGYAPFSVELTHFIDGVQRTSKVLEIRWQAKGFGTVPMFVAQVACIVLRREARSLSVCGTESTAHTLVEVPIEFLCRNARKSVRTAFEHLRSHPSFQWVDTSYDTRQSDVPTDAIQIPPLHGYYQRIPDEEFRSRLSDPNWLCNQSRKWTAKSRDAMEQQVLDRLAGNYGKATTDSLHYRLFVRDGTLTAARGPFVTSAIGISKSFNTRFLAPHLQTRVIALPEYHRTPVFRFQRATRGLEPDEVEAEEEPLTKSPQKHTVLSWYVRIREFPRSLPYWGLVRVELHPNLLGCRGSSDRWTADDSKLISAISGAIIAEASPTSHPDPRWHNLLYPIRCCERFARARMIPHDTVKHLSMWGVHRDD